MEMVTTNDEEIEPERTCVCLQDLTWVVVFSPQLLVAAERPREFNVRVVELGWLNGNIVDNIWRLRHQAIRGATRSGGSKHDEALIQDSKLYCVL